MQAYCDGINDFVKGVGMFEQEQTARALPPEFLLFGITPDSFEPYDLKDILQIGLVTNWDEGTFQISSDLLKESLRRSDPDLARLVEDLIPFTSEVTDKLVTTVDDNDLRQWGQFSEQTLIERYKQQMDHVMRAQPKYDDTAS